MKNDNKNNEITQVYKKDERILFGEKVSVCFACGEKIGLDTKVCPYCNTKLEFIE